MFNQKFDIITYGKHSVSEKLAITQNVYLLLICSLCLVSSCWQCSCSYSEAYVSEHRTNRIISCTCIYSDTVSTE